MAAAQHAADDAAGEYSRRDHLVAFEVPEMARPAQEYDLHRLLGVQERETGEGKAVGEHREFALSGEQHEEIGIASGDFEELPVLAPDDGGGQDGLVGADCGTVREDVEVARGDVAGPREADLIVGLCAVGAELARDEAFLTTAKRLTGSPSR